MPTLRAMKLRIEPGFVGFALLVYALAGELVWPFFWAAGVHELAHLIAVWLLGGSVQTMTLRFADAQITTAPMGYAAEIACALAGPAANLLCCFCFQSGLPVFAVVSLLLGCYNLLPVGPLDGGRVLYAILALATEQETAQKVLLVVSIGVCAAMLLAAVYAAVFCAAGIWPLLAAGRLALQMARMGERKEKQVAFPTAGG